MLPRWPVLFLTAVWLTAVSVGPGIVAPATAQAPTPSDAPFAQPDSSDEEGLDGEEKKEFTSQDCAKLPGGNAPINRLARLEGKLSIRNLELTYYGKPLAQRRRMISTTSAG